MSSVNLERIIPGLAERRAQERINRGLAFAGLTHTVCGREILPMTPGHRLQLQLMGNGFASPSDVLTLADVFVFLWVLSPHNVGGVEAARQQRFLREDVMKMDLPACVSQIAAYVKDQVQDSIHESTKGGGGKDNAAWIHWMAADSYFYQKYLGIGREEYARTPLLVLQQYFRVWKMDNPDVERTADGRVITLDPVFRNASDGMVSQFHRENADRIKAWHLKQKERRN